MITLWERRDDYWTNTTSLGFDRDLKYRGYLEIRALGLSGLREFKKNDLRMLRRGTSEPLRQESAADTGSVLWVCPDIPGGGGTESQVQEVRYRETRETALAGEQSFLHEAICLLCRTEVSSHDGQRCSKRVETELAHGKGTGKGVHAGAVAAQSGGSTQGNRDRRNIFAERAYLPNSGQRSGKREADLVWWRGSLRDEP